MKKIIILFTFLFFLGNILAQNTHFAYNLSNNTTANSAVTIVHSNGTAYLIQTQIDYIHVSEIDPTNMQPIGSSISYNISSNFMSFQSSYLNGGYEDFQGNLILYGNLYANYQLNYLAIRIDLNTMDLDYNSNSGPEIIEGCCGYDSNGDLCNLFLLDQSNEVIVLNDQLAPITTYSLIPKDLTSKITDISWNPHTNNFIASGSYIDPLTIYASPFLMYFNCNPSFPTYFDKIDMFYITNQQNFNIAEGRILHEVIDDHHLILCQDLRNIDNDYIWLIHFDDYMTRNVSNSTIFEYPYKLFNQDMKYNHYTNKLTLLGRIVYCMKGINYIAQVDPFSLTGMDIGQILDQNSNSNCTYTPPTNVLYGNELFLQRLELNPFNSRYTILSTGISKNILGDSPYITETYDISLAQCDQFIYTNEQYPSTSAVTIGDDYLNFTYVFPSPLTPLNLFYLNQSIVCNDVAYCGKGIEKPQQENKPFNMVIPNISLFGAEYFQCDNFSITLNFFLYDITGKLVLKGTTENGIKTALPSLNNGIYILSVIDEKGSRENKKVVILK